MEITVESVQGQVPVTVMKMGGELDAKSYLGVIAEAKQLYDDGARDLLVDMGELTFMASSGLFALHSIGLIMRGETPPDPEAGWGALRSVKTHVEYEALYEVHCKILNPQPRVARTLEMSGFSQIFEIFSDRDAAVASFG
jgi:anti-anti-sigma regulatory factor